MANEIVVHDDKQENKAGFLGKTYNKVVVGSTALLPVFAFALEGDALDMSAATTQLSLGVAAIGALGAAKLAPAALSWVWAMVTRTAQR